MSDALGGLTTFYFGGQHASYLYLGGVAGGLGVLRREYDHPAAATTHRSGCPAPVGRLVGRSLGPIGLDEPRARVRRRMWRSRGRPSPYTDVFCFTPIGIRVGYPPPAVERRLNPRLRRAVAGRVVLILTANRRYALRGVQPGMTLSFARGRLRLAPPFRTGANTWYMTQGRGTRGVLKVRHGRIAEIGLAEGRLVWPRALALRFFASF